MRKYKLVLLVLLLFLGIGFASVSTTLTIDAGAELSKNSEDFDVKFTKAMIDGIDVTSSISNDGLEISFGTKELINSGDKSVLKYVIKNNSTMYDATISINCVSNDEHSNLYTVVNSIDSSIEGKSSKSGKVTVTLNSTQASTIQGALTCTLSATPGERTTVSEPETNPHIKAVYRYNENGSGTGTDYTGCLGGEETGCTNIISTVTNETEYNVGDIVKYEVSPGVEKYFNVLYDNGATLTMQQRENTVRNVAWYAASNDNTKGPTTILPALEEATSSWTYVNDQTYTVGTDTFGTGSFATNAKACPYLPGSYPNSTTCTDTTKYPSFTKTNVKARMITAQEAGEMGCKLSTVNTCKKFMNNYLNDSTSYGGNVVDNVTENGASINHGYWTVSALMNSTYSALGVGYNGGVHCDNHANATYFGARAVVEVNK